MTRFGESFLLGIVVLILGLALALSVLGLSPLRALFAGLNLATLVAYGFDKWRARAGGSRVPETALHALAACGGTPGAFAGQMLFRHKTRDRRFRRVFYTIAVIQGALLLVLNYAG